MWLNSNAKVSASMGFITTLQYLIPVFLFGSSFVAASTLNLGTVLIDKPLFPVLSESS
jgi:hypothetical protein